MSGSIITTGAFLIKLVTVLWVGKDNREENDVAWKVNVKDLQDWDLDIKNPTKIESEKTYSSDELISMISDKLSNSQELLSNIKSKLSWVGGK